MLMPDLISGGRESQMFRQCNCQHLSFTATNCKQCRCINLHDKPLRSRTTTGDLWCNVCLWRKCLLQKIANCVGTIAESHYAAPDRSQTRIVLQVAITIALIAGTQHGIFFSIWLMNESIWVRGQWTTICSMNDNCGSARFMVTQCMTMTEGIAGSSSIPHGNCPAMGDSQAEQKLSFSITHPQRFFLSLRSGITHHDFVAALNTFERYVRQ